MVKRFLTFLSLVMGPAMSDGTTNCVDITLVKDCKETPECGFYRISKSCMMLDDMPCDQYEWPTTCNPISHCTWNHFSNACEAAADVECGKVKWPKGCKATHGCGYNTETEKCVELNDLTCEVMHGDACKEFPDSCYFFKKSRACASLPAVDVRDYKFGGHLPNSCPDGYAAVTDVLECRSVAVALGKEWFSTIAAMFTGVTGVCSIIEDSPKNALVNGHMYFGSIGVSRMLAQQHHKIVCGIPTLASMGCEDAVPGLCQIMAKAGSCTDSSDEIKAELSTNCPLSCNTCPDSVPTGTPTSVPTEQATGLLFALTLADEEEPCEDLLPTLCPFMSQAGLCETTDEAKLAELEQSCPVTCDLCPDTRRFEVGNADQDIDYGTHRGPEYDIQTLNGNLHQ